MTLGRRALAAWRAPSLRWPLTLGACAFAFVIAALVAPHAPFDPRSSVAAARVAYGCSFAAVCAAAIASGATVGPLPLRALAAWVPIAALLAWLAWAGLFAQGGAVAIAASLAVWLALLVGGGIVGAVVGARIEHPGHLLVVAVVSSMADVWSVLTPEGPSAAVVEHAPLLSVVALPFPMLGTESIEPLLGGGDVVFVALYLTVCRRFELGTARMVLALASAFVATAFAVVLLERAIPALPFLGAAVLVAHREARLPPERDRRGAWIAMAVLAALLVAVLAMRA